MKTRYRRKVHTLLKTLLAVPDYIMETAFRMNSLPDMDGNVHDPEILTDNYISVRLDNNNG